MSQVSCKDTTCKVMLLRKKTFKNIAWDIHGPSGVCAWDSVVKGWDIHCIGHIVKMNSILNKYSTLLLVM